MSIRVVVADDQTLVRAGFRLLVDSAPDLEVVGEAVDGAQAVELARQQRPQVVLMDIRMPTMDRLEATRQITAVYLRRVADQLGMDVDVGYLTGLGDDEYSEGMRVAWATEGVLDRSQMVEGRLPGLYTIRVDDRGERRFAYWRSESAARTLFGGTEWVEYVDGDVVHLSGITLQLTTPKAREALLHRLHELRMHGVRISLDTNYRPSGWTSPDEAARVMDQFSHVATIALATWEDEVAMHHCRTPMDCADRLAAQGVREVVVKSGANGAHLLADGRLQHIPAAPAEKVVDTTAAGDSFAGAYLAARIDGQSPVDAARIAVEVAAVVVGHSGAVVPADVSLATAVSRAINRPWPSPQ